MSIQSILDHKGSKVVTIAPDTQSGSRRPPAAP